MLGEINHIRTLVYTKDRLISWNKKKKEKKSKIYFAPSVGKSMKIGCTISRQEFVLGVARWVISIMIVLGRMIFKLTVAPELSKTMFL